MLYEQISAFCCICMRGMRVRSKLGASEDPQAEADRNEKRTCRGAKGLMSMGNRFARTKPAVLLTGVLMVALGIAVLVNPIGAVETLVRLIGWVLVAYGVLTLIMAFVKGDPMRDAPSEIALGIITFVPGLIMGLFPKVFVGIVWTFLGIIILATGVLDVFEASDLRRARNPLAASATVSGIITILLGVLVILVPMASAALGMLVAAAALLIDGVTEIIFGLGM